MKRAFLATLLSIAVTQAGATVIDFSSTTTGDKPNGFTVDGVSFYDTSGANLSVGDFGPQSDGNALAVFSDDTSALRMTFTGIQSSLEIAFGNDDPSVTLSGDVALLRLFLSSNQVGETTVLLNQNDLMDQVISLSGINFDEATFVYANASLNPINLIEAVDNITFTPSNGVPEPATLGLLGLGLAGLGFSRRRKS